jgi:deaminated glutathione amidase
MRIAVIQMTSIDDKAANLRAAERLIEIAVEEDRPDLVVLPEVWAFQGGSLEARKASAETIPGGEAYACLAHAARRHAVWVHGGSFYERAGEKLFNATVVFDRSGREAAFYRKIHLFDVVTPDGREYRESDVVGRGEQVVTYEAEGVRLGCTICYDLRFGELYRALAAAGAQVLVVPAAFTLETGKDHWETLLRARAIENAAWVVAAAQVGTYPTHKGPRACWGHSMIVDPWGHVVARVTDRPGFVSARIDLGYLGRVREMIPVHQHRVLKG